MINQIISPDKKQTSDIDHLVDNAVLTLRDEYGNQKSLFAKQPAMIRHFLEAQAKQLAEQMLSNQTQLRFKLPDKIIINGEAESNPTGIPNEFREQSAGGVLDRFARTDARTLLQIRLTELEGSGRKSVAASARMLRFATAQFMVHILLPAGRSVIYGLAEGEEIPSIPLGEQAGPESAITASTDAIIEECTEDQVRGELQVPFVPAARRFYLPQWVAFDHEGQILVNSENEAEAHINSMQHFISILHTAVGIAPYFVADQEYQQKRYGMLGQLINQARALANYQVKQMIALIMRRANTHDLNRGLSLSMPFFDDQSLELRKYDFVVIPAGRIMFLPAFVVRAVRMEQVKVAQDTRISPSTRKYLLLEFRELEEAFKE
ncbi:MAG: hypothetical protein WCI88_04240 [Chloroflexota bacterium]|jgi:hypothetical protein